MGIYVTGDVHGNIYRIRDSISQIEKPSNNDFIIIAGDAGFEYEECVKRGCKKEAKKFSGIWIVLRGNHDSCYWNHENTDGWKTIQSQGCIYLYEEEYPNIWYLPDNGCIYRLNDYNILFIPGAYSVDKWYRLYNHRPWNPKEQLSDQEKEDLEFLTRDWIQLGFDIDFVIGHTFPRKLESYYQDLFFSGLDQSTIDKSMENWLTIFSDTYEKISSFKQYFGGHFHDDRILTDQYTMLYNNIVNLVDYEKE